MHFLIIGGSDAGISAGLRAHELDPACEITLVLADNYPNFSICGLPFFLSGETPDWRSLAHRTEFPGIQLIPNHTAEAIDPARKAVEIRGSGGERRELRYDKLLVGTGARPVRPAIEGLDLPGVFRSTRWKTASPSTVFWSNASPGRPSSLEPGISALKWPDAPRASRSQSNSSQSYGNSAGDG